MPETKRPNVALTVVVVLATLLGITLSSHASAQPPPQGLDTCQSETEEQPRPLLIDGATMTWTGTLTSGDCTPPGWSGRWDTVWLAIEEPMTITVSSSTNVVTRTWWATATAIQDVYAPGGFRLGIGDAVETNHPVDYTVSVHARALSLTPQDIGDADRVVDLGTLSTVTGDLSYQGTWQRPGDPSGFLIQAVGYDGHFSSHSDVYAFEVLHPIDALISVVSDRSSNRAPFAIIDSKGDIVFASDVLQRWSSFSAVAIPLTAGQYYIRTDSTFPVPGAQSASEGYTVQIAAVATAFASVSGNIIARRLADGRTEFGFRPNGSEPILPATRYFPTNAPVGRWLTSSQVEVNGTSIGRISAIQRNDGRIEFSFLPSGGGSRILPSTRFFPVNPELGTWLQSSPIEIGGTTQ